MAIFNSYAIFVYQAGYPIYIPMESVQEPIGPQKHGLCKWVII
jgi:hypothetical protein